MGSRASNRSYETAGLEDPDQHWMRHAVRVKSHPEWGTVRVLRWFPAVGDQPAMLRVYPPTTAVPSLVPVTDVEIVD